MSWLNEPSLSNFVATCGYLAVFALVAAESSGIPLPGETALLSAAVYAGTTHRIDILVVILAAAAGAICGDNLGFLIGREAGHRLLLRYGRYLHIDAPRLKVGQYLFLRYGGRIVFLGRFIAILRVFAALLAGANCMPWRTFLVYNALSGTLWATVYGTGGYVLGEAARRFGAQLGPIAFVVTASVILGLWLFLRNHETRLVAEAERALPEPVTSKFLRPRSRGRTDGQTIGAGLARSAAGRGTSETQAGCRGDRDRSPR